MSFSEDREKAIVKATEAFGHLDNESERREVLDRLGICGHCLCVGCSGWCDYPGTPID